MKRVHYAIYKMFVVDKKTQPDLWDGPFKTEKEAWDRYFEHYYKPDEDGKRPLFRVAKVTEDFLPVKVK